MLVRCLVDARPRADHDITGSDQIVLDAPKHFTDTPFYPVADHCGSYRTPHDQANPGERTGSRFDVNNAIRTTYSALL